MYYLVRMKTETAGLVLQMSLNTSDKLSQQIWHDMQYHLIR